MEIEKYDFDNVSRLINELQPMLDSKKNISDVLHKALNYLHEITEKINKEIVEIKKDIESHKP